MSGHVVIGNFISPFHVINSINGQSMISEIFFSFPQHSVTHTNLWFVFTHVEKYDFENSLEAFTSALLIFRSYRQCLRWVIHTVSIISQKFAIFKPLIYVSLQNAVRKSATVEVAQYLVTLYMQDENLPSTSQKCICYVLSIII